METTLTAFWMRDSYLCSDAGLSWHIVYEGELTKVVVFFVVIDHFFLAVRSLLQGFSFSLFEEVESVALFTLE